MYSCIISLCKETEELPVDIPYDTFFPSGIVGACTSGCGELSDKVLPGPERCLNFWRLMIDMIWLIWQCFTSVCIGGHRHQVFTPSRCRHGSSKIEKEKESYYDYIVEVIYPLSKSLKLFPNDGHKRPWSTALHGNRTHVFTYNKLKQQKNIRITIII